MSAPSYDSSNYDAAAKKYKTLQDKYTGESGWNLATNQAETAARKQSAQAGNVAGASAQGAARSAGMSRSKAIATGAQAAGSSALQTYGNSYNSNLSGALQNNSNTLNAQGNLMDAERQKDTNNYNSEAAKWSGTMSAIGGAWNGVASAVSDENKKDISEKSNTSARCDELLAKLKGGN